MDLTSFLNHLGENLRKARWVAGMTQEDVAAHGITYRYYQEVERGQRNVSVHTLLRLAEALDTTVAALVDMDPEATDKARAKLSNAKAEPPRRGRKPRYR